MKVILLQTIKGVGNKGEVKDLNNGYARNFLIPKKLAQMATPQLIKKSEEEKEIRDKKRKETLDALKKEAEEIKKITLSFNVKTGEKGEMFGSITEKEIEDAFHKKGFKHIDIKEKHTLKSVGEHIVNVNLGSGITSEIKVVISSERQRKE